MEKLVIEKEVEKISSINRTIRIKPEHFDKLTDLSEQYNLSLSKIITQCLDYALKNLEE